MAQVQCGRSGGGYIGTRQNFPELWRPVHNPGAGEGLPIIAGLLSFLLMYIIHSEAITSILLWPILKMEEVFLMEKGNI